MKNQKGGTRAWIVEAWLGGDDELWFTWEIHRHLFLDKEQANKCFDRICMSDIMRKVVLSEIDLIPGHVLRKTVAV